MAEVGKAHYPFPADTQHGPDQGVGFVNLLQGLTQYDIVEGVFGIVKNFFIDVALENRQAFLYALGDLGFIMSIQEAMICKSNRMLLFLAFTIDTL